jgi:hypothetical protein
MIMEHALCSISGMPTLLPDMRSCMRRAHVIVETVREAHAFVTCLERRMVQLPARYTRTASVPGQPTVTNRCRSGPAER